MKKLVLSMPREENWQNGEIPLPASGVLPLVVPLREQEWEQE
jgi:hypothetical protein